MLNFPQPPLGGVYPRVCGGNGKGATSGWAVTGLSPRGRGKPGEAVDLRDDVLSIPAWAGETPCLRYWGCHAGVYPRVGGGNDDDAPGRAGGLGLSPRGRGKRLRWTIMPVRPGSIPAWAGETGSFPRIYCNGTVYPRVGGGNAESRL